MLIDGNKLFGPPPPSNPPPSEPAASDGAEDGGAPPVEETGDAGGAATSDAGDEAGADAPPPRPATVEVANRSGATPFVAPPSVDAARVDEIASLGDRARLETAFDGGFDDAEVDVARAFAQAANDRAQAQALVAAVQPAPENAPSLFGDTARLREEGANRPEPTPRAA